MSINILLDMVADAFPERPAIQFEDRVLTVGQLRDAASALAAVVRDAGAEELVFFGVNGPSLPLVLFGAAMAGVPAVPLNYRLPPGQVVELLNRLRRPLIIADPAFVDGIAAAGFAVRSGDGLIDQMLEEDAAGPAAAVVDDNQPAVVLFTSGTTAAPKAAVLRHRHLLSYVLQTVDFASAPDDDLALISVPPYHIAGVGSALTNIYSGRRVVYLANFSPERWLELLRAQKVTVAMVVPTMLARIVEYLGGRPANVPSLKTLAYGGSRAHQDVLESALVSFAGTGFVNAYGLTETSSTISLLGPDEHRAAFASAQPSIRGRLGSVGRPVPGIEVQIRGVDNEILPPGRVGELWVRGAQVAGEYAETGSVLDPDGWFRTRDLSRLDHDGYLFIEGRTDDIIIRGAENISPAEVEAVMERHPDVHDVAVLGLPDTEWGECIAAAVVLRSGATADPAALQEWVRKRSRSSRTPDVVIIRDALPYSATGKLLRRDLFEELTETAR
jgi:acyl-CoA synthetase (AMP-forming)/AMP-acid ligase II